MDLVAFEEFRCLSYKIWEGKKCKFGKVSKKCKDYGLFDIFWDMLDKGKGTLGQMGASDSSSTQLEQLPLTSLEKWQLFQFWPYFSTSASLKSGIPTHKMYIFGISNNRAIR